jgi:hypothetical protein
VAFAIIAEAFDEGDVEGLRLVEGVGLIVPLSPAVGVEVEGVGAEGRLEVDCLLQPVTTINGIRKLIRNANIR